MFLAQFYEWPKRVKPYVINFLNLCVSVRFVLDKNRGRWSRTCYGTLMTNTLPASSSSNSFHLILSKGNQIALLCWTHHLLAVVSVLLNLFLVFVFCLYWNQYPTASIIAIFKHLTFKR